MNIKNERVCALAKRAAEVTGRTQTSVIELALERLLAEHGATGPTPEVRAQRIDDIVDHLQRAWRDGRAPTPSTEDLYDDAGLPA